LNGRWQYIIDPYETGFYNYRWQERDERDREAYWNSEVPDNKTDRKEHGWSDKYSLTVPGDWNSQAEKLLYYEGTVWYRKSFDAKLPTPDQKHFIYFGAVNYRADVYLNGKKLGMHKGGFTPFNFEIPAGLLKARDNNLVVKVDNKRAADEIPTLNTDWWNYGGITRDVSLVTVPQTFIRDYSLQLKNTGAGTKGKELEGWVKLNAPASETVVIELPELGVTKEIRIQGDSAAFSIPLTAIQVWSPQTPKLYRVVWRTSSERIEDKIGFRTIEVRGKQVLLNGSPIFLRGISIHEEIPQKGRRANSRKDALQLLGQARELHANMVRLAHYPHNENMVRVADSLGILVWSEIPVYWTIDFSSTSVLQKAKAQLEEMITRDRNRASVIIWSVGNETPVNEPRTRFMSELVRTAKGHDSSRLVSAALEVHTVNGILTIDDPLGAYTDLVSVNEYLGWYSGLPSGIAAARWEVKYNKPLFFSETGAEALSGFRGDSLTRWSEDYQAWYYREQVAMMRRMPDNFVGLSPWILNDFRSPRRNHPVYQEGWNNKGLYDHKGRKKAAFYVLKGYYDAVANEKK
ncbi:MAG: Beta-glucuronidase, partial [Flaviaesturariibacter sp.]|nr:Beta-glucuronidase [Flaviaesturariibacter sp.]